MEENLSLILIFSATGSREPEIWKSFFTSKYKIFCEHFKSRVDKTILKYSINYTIVSVFKNWKPFIEWHISALCVKAYNQY